MPRLGRFKGEIIQSGCHPGLPNQQVPLWARGSNFIFRDRSAKVAAQHSPLFERMSENAITGMFAGEDDGDPVLIWGDKIALYIGHTAPSATDVTRISGAYTGTDKDRWSIVQFGAQVLATNGVDAVQYKADISTTDPFVDIDTVSDLAGTFRCQVLRTDGAFVLAFNTDNYIKEYRWCNEDDVTVWSPLAANKARDFQMRELISPIIAVTSLGNLMVIHGKQQNFVSGFSGAPFYWPYNHLIDGVGAVNKFSVTAADNRIFGFGPSGMYVLDGTVFNYIDDPSMHKYVYEEQLDQSSLERVTVWADQTEGIIYFSFPTSSGGETVGYNYKSGAWSMYDWWRTAADMGGPWGHPVMGDDNGRTWIQLPTAGAWRTPGNPVGIGDSLSLESYYGMGGYGQGGYGGSWEGED